MHYITIGEAAEKWNISVRTVQHMCQNGLIHGAYKWGRAWKVPFDAEKPADNRTKTAKSGVARPMPMPRKSPFLDMTDLYHTPGKADECAKALDNQPEAKLLFEAEIAYSRGEIDKVYDYAQYFLSSHSGFFAVVAGGMLLALCAMWRGDINMWEKAKRHISSAPCSKDTDHDIIKLCLAAADSAIRNTESFPEWFKIGCFESLPAASHPAAKVYYIKYLMVYAQELALGNIELKNVKGLGLMRTMPYIIEPMIVQSMVDKTVMGELYLRLLCAVAYRSIDDEKRAIEHLDRAIALALPDMLLGTLAEHRRQLGYLLDDRLALADPDAAKKLKELHKGLSVGWHKLHNIVLDKTVSIDLTNREREVSTLAAIGFSNTEIADKLSISLNSVKSVISMAMNKTGARNRYELGNFI